MPLLDDAKTCYVGTTPITTIMAGSVQVWPKGPPPPKVPVMTECVFRQPVADPSPHDALLIPETGGDRSKLFQQVVDGVAINDISVRYAISDSKPTDSDWTVRTFTYRNDPNSNEGYGKFSTYATALTDQNTNRKIACVDLGTNFLGVNRQKLYMQTSYAATGYEPVWLNVLGTQSKNMENGVPYPGSAYYLQYFGTGVTSYRIAFPFELPEVKLWSGSLTPSYGSTFNTTKVEVRKTTNEKVRHVGCTYYGVEEAALSDGTLQKIYKYDLLSLEEYVTSAPAQNYQYTIQTTENPILTSDIATADLPSTP